MTRILLAAVALALVAACALVSANADHSYHRFDYVGYWETVDPVDGEVSTMSITPNPDGSFTIVTGADFITSCGTDHGQGHFTGTGVAVGGKLISHDRQMRCDGGGVTHSPADYVPDAQHDLLVVVPENGREPLAFHRMSSNPRY